MNAHALNPDTLTQNTISLAPSLFAQGPAVREEQPHAQLRTLVELMHDGFYLLLLLRNRYTPGDADRFAVQIRRLLDNFERNAKPLDQSAEDVFAAKYAFCAAIDEAILTSDMPIREVWERAPLQLMLFGDQLAGRNFFAKLEEVRQRGASAIQALEVFYMCLLTGFEGKYRLESKEKLNYLIATLDKEIAHLKGKRAQFAPHWKAPDNVKHMMKADIPLWAAGAALAFFGVVAFAGMSYLLARHANDSLGAYFDVVKLASKVANITISLP